MQNFIDVESYIVELNLESCSKLSADSQIEWLTPELYPNVNDISTSDC